MSKGYAIVLSLSDDQAERLKRITEAKRRFLEKNKIKTETVYSSWTMESDTLEELIAAGEESFINTALKLGDELYGQFMEE